MQGYKYLILTGLFFLLQLNCVGQQSFSHESRAHKKLWRKWFRHNREAYNPYLERKASQKPSAQLRNSMHSNDAKMKRKDRRRMRRAKRHLNQ